MVQGYIHLHPQLPTELSQSVDFARWRRVATTQVGDLCLWEEEEVGSCGLEKGKYRLGIYPWEMELQGGSSEIVM